ncbi:hypothetical protein JL720_13268 [Aureococcus anophagefferens]|nr:hypothetical protein JL720_13268 [Aureococcus anophagefferens]
MSRVAPTLAAPAPPEASPSDGGVEMEAPAPSPRFADAQAVDDERFVGDSSWWACLSEWFRSEQGDGPESFAQLRKEAVATLYGDAEGGWAAAATSSGSVVSAGDSAAAACSSAACVAVAPNPLVVVSDAGRTVDDELALVLLRAFAERGLVQPTAVVANVSPARQGGTRVIQRRFNALARGSSAARSTRWACTTCPWAWARTAAAAGRRHLSETADQYVPGEQSQAAKALMSGRRLLHRTFVRARPGSLTLLLLSSTKDAALFLRDNTDLFKAKIRVVVVSGGCAANDGGLEPDAAAHNVAVDAASADFLFRRLQELRLAELGSPIGWRLRSATRDAVLAEWAACRDDDVQRVAFLKRACGCADVPATEDDVWPFATAPRRGAVALCCCVPELRSRFFEPTTVSCQGCDHLVVGCEPAASSVKPDPGSLRAVLEQSYQHGISLNSSLCRPEIIVVSDPGQDLDDEMAFVLLRALIEEGLVSCAGVVCNLRPAGRRALLARGTLDCLGLQHVPVAAGSDGGSKKHEDTFSDSAAHYMPEAFDAADGLPLKPDTANNNTFDMAAAEELYANIQRLRVPMVVLSRHAAYACPMPRDAVWKSHLQPDFNGGDRTEDDSVWDLVVSFNMYDPLALMACVPDLRRRFFRCVEKLASVALDPTGKKAPDEVKDDADERKEPR